MYSPSTAEPPHEDGCDRSSGLLRKRRAMQHVADFRMEETYLEREPGPVALAERGPSDRIRPWSEILRAQRLVGRSQEVYGAGQVTPYDRENLAWRLNNDNRQRKEASPGRGDALGLTTVKVGVGGIRR